MKKFIYYFYFILLVGLSILNHYLYDLTNNNYFIGLFVPRNESIFEHLKLLFYPSLLIMFIDLFIDKDRAKTFIAHIFSVSVGLIFIVVTYYTISGIIGKNIDFINIGIMISSIILYLFLKYTLYKLDIRRYFMFGIFMLVLLVLMFTVFSIRVPNLGIFI